MDDRHCSPNDGELRCICGSLMARVTPAGVELKCRRCKRVIVVPLTPSEDWESGSMR
jgi:hypothetical protein